MPDVEIQVGATIGRYKVLQNPSHDASDPVAHPLGRGGTAAVYLVQQDMSNGISTPRALKLFSPSEKIEGRRVARGQTPGRQSFLQEISSISSLTHQNLVKIIDAGELRPDQPYFVMEYVEGSALDNLLDSTAADFENWKTRAQLDPFQCLRMVQQVCWPTSYLHSRRFFHFDIAPKNIFVREVNGRPHIMLGDLGVGRRVPPLSEITKSNSHTKIEIAGTKKFTPVELPCQRFTPYRCAIRSMMAADESLGIFPL
jgi:serine/threonine protein kinase